MPQYPILISFFIVTHPSHYSPTLFLLPFSSNIISDSNISSPPTSPPTIILDGVKTQKSKINIFQMT